MLSIRFLSHDIYYEYCIRLARVEGSVYVEQAVGKKIYDDVLLTQYLARKCFERNIFIPAYREYCTLYFSSEFVDSSKYEKIEIMKHFLEGHLTYARRMDINYIRHQQAIDWDYLYGEKIELYEQERALREERKKEQNFFF